MPGVTYTLGELPERRDARVEGDAGVFLRESTSIGGANPGVYPGGVLHRATLTWRRNALRFAQLFEVANRIGRLEKAHQQHANSLTY